VYAITAWGGFRPVELKYLDWLFMLSLRTWLYTVFDWCWTVIAWR